MALELARRGRARTCVALSPAGAWQRPLDLTRLLWLFRVGAAAGRPSWIRGIARHDHIRRLLLKGMMEHGERVPARMLRIFSRTSWAAP